MNKKVTVIGAGLVGSTCAQYIWNRSFADVVLLDVVEGMPQSKAADIMHSRSLVCSNASIIGTNDYRDTKDSDIVILTLRGRAQDSYKGTGGKSTLSGRARGIVNNAPAVKEAVLQLKEYCPNCVYVVVTNPVDIISRLVYQVSELPPNRIIGLGTMLDTLRLQTMIADELMVSAEDVSACVLGQHADCIVPVPRLSSVGGVPLDSLITNDRFNAIIERVKRQKGFYAAAIAAAHIAESVVLNKKRVFPVSVCLDGAYGLADVFLSVIAKIGAKGVDRIIEVELNNEEDQLMQQAGIAVRELASYLDLS